MKNPWLHRFAILLAIAVLLQIIVNAMVGPGSQPTASMALAQRVARSTVITLTFGLTVWLLFVRGQIYWLGWLTVSFGVLQDSGAASLLGAIPRPTGIAHAILVPSFFATAVAFAMVTSPAWNRGPEHVSDYGWPSMRSLAILTPILVVLQIALGAGFRQKALTLLPHVLGAMFVALMILLESIFVLQQFPTHRALRPAAKTLLGVAFGQVFLGMTALIMKSMADDTDMAVVATVASHVTGGAVTLAATIVLSILIRRNVQPRIEADDEDQEAPPAS